MEWLYIINGFVAAISLWVSFWCWENDNEIGGWLNFAAFTLNIATFLRHFWS